MLSVLGCKFVDDVLIDAPLVVNLEMIRTLRIDIVLIGSTRDDVEVGEDRGTSSSSGWREGDGEKDGEGEGEGEGDGEGDGEGEGQGQGYRIPDPDVEDPYRIPRDLGMLKIVKSSSGSSVLDFVERIECQRERFYAKYTNKTQIENDFYNTKYSNL